ncbi:MAG: hypothetical protein AAEB43_01560, partial [Acidimicrobiales bacterium]
HTDFSMLVVYVDDLMLIATGLRTTEHWAKLKAVIEFKHNPASIDKRRPASGPLGRGRRFSIED